MTDKTTARDRAIEDACAVALREIGDAAMSTPKFVLARRIVFALRAHPEVLRALAGAPDVTALLAACDDLDRRSRQRVGEIERGERHGPPIWRQLSTEEIRRLLVAAPEGVDAADEQDECATQMHHPLTVCRTCHPHEWAQRKSGEIANSGRCRCTDDEACPEHEALEDEPDGMDLEAQGDLHRQLVDLVKLGEEKQRLLADQLATEQAGIGRVREKHFQTIGGYCHVCATWDPIAGASGVPYPCPTVRALDGDTTEEK